MFFFKITYIYKLFGKKTQFSNLGNMRTENKVEGVGKKVEQKQP